MRFYLDENLSPEIARIARRQGLDVSSTHEEAREGRPDDDQLAFAAADGRCIVTMDYGDYKRWTARFRQAGRPHAGVLYVPGKVTAANFSRLVGALLRFDADHPKGMGAYDELWITYPSDA